MELLVLVLVVTVMKESVCMIVEAEEAWKGDT